MRIGLLGGSFNPAHEGHRAVSIEALNRLALDRVWWLVAPQNPLKDPGQNAPYDKRLARAAAVEAHPRIDVSDLERRWGCRYTIETICRLKEHFPAHRFVWLMGVDNFAQLHNWEDWTGIVDQVPIAVFNRPGYLFKAAASTAALRYARYRIPDVAAAALPDLDPPAWSFIEIPLNPQSSTALRRQSATDGNA